jgi:hypothetical protein
MGGKGAKEKDERVGIWERLEGRDIDKDGRKGEIERYEKEGRQRDESVFPHLMYNWLGLPSR